MYQENERKNINWNSVIKKGLLALLIIATILVIIWLYTRSRNNEINNNNIIVNQNNNTNLLNTYSNEFISGYSYFHDTAKEYLITNTLPNVGQSISFTLNDLITKGVLIPFAYKDNTSCDVYNSVIELSNQNNNYILTTTLVCGNEKANISEEVKCSNICKQDCECKCNQEITEKVTEYEYKQKYNTTEKVYNCPEGYEVSGTKCIKSNNNYGKLNIVTEYSCLEGYEKSGTGADTKCTKKDVEIVNATQKYTESCVDGYTLVKKDNKNTCVKEITDVKNATYTYQLYCSKGTVASDGKDAFCKISTDVVNATPITTCPDGYTKSGTSCIKNIVNSINATAKTTYTCDNGYKLSGTSCTKETTTTKDATATTTYSCPAGYTQSGSGVNTKCSYTKQNTTDPIYTCSQGELTSDHKCKVITYTTNKTCTSGYTLENQSCIKYLYTAINYGYNYDNCEYVGVCNQSGCIGSYVYKCTQLPTNKTIGNTAYYNASAKCNEGTLTNGKCVSTTTETKDKITTTKYTCSDGYTLNGTKCSKTTTTTINATKKTTYSCDNGYTLNGTKCNKTTTTTINATNTGNYECDNGYVLTGTKCYKTAEKPMPIYYYVCDNGYTLNGTKCSKTITDAIDTTKNYYNECNDGYALNKNNKCEKGTTLTSKVIKTTSYTCESGYTKVGLGEESKCIKETKDTINATVSTKNITKYKYKWSTETELKNWTRTGKTREVDKKIS